MKYVRKKDGTIVKLKPHRFYKHVLEGDKLYLSGKKKILYISNVVSHADTIEELCDEFVYECGCPCLCYYNQRKNKWLDYHDDMELTKLQIKTIKGAIWTDKGLIYVAKMNEKGELELL